MRIFIAGNPGWQHVGGHFLRAAKSLALPVAISDVSLAYQAPWLLRQWNWRFRGRRPARLHTYAEDLSRSCAAFGAELLLTTGIAPLPAAVVRRIRQSGVCVVNFLTDDPWNPAHKGSWFLDSLREYDCVFSPRRANVQDLLDLGCRHVSYLPFAYAPDIHFPEPAQDADEERQLRADVVFIGGGDADRLPMFRALAQAGLQLALYGGYWKSDPVTARYARGFAGASLVRKAIHTGSLSVCLVRRANRDGHAMRSYEVPAMEGCPLVEDSPEHRELFGPEGESVLYFESENDLIAKARWLVENQEERNRLRGAARARIVQGANRYADRLTELMNCVKAL